MKIYSENKKASHNYEILEKFEAGISLIGPEVKSIKNGRISISGAYVLIKEKEVYLVGANIPPYQPANMPENYNPQRDRKLLLTKKEIKYLIGKSQSKGISLVPLKIYERNAKIKLEFGIGKGRKKYDKREKIKKRESKKEIERKLKIWG